MNFEDFLTLHLSEDELLTWEAICISNNHFEEPLHSKEYMSLFKATIFHNYEKGELPFAINNNAMHKFVSNYTRLKTNMHCFFADCIIENIFKKMEIFSSYF